MTTYNANRPHGFGILTPETFAPYPKNPVIGAFFREIERADELGSGMRNLMKYGRKYGGADPQLIEGDIFRMIISVPEFGTKIKVPSVTPEVKKLLNIMQGEISRGDLLAALGLKDEKHFRQLYQQAGITMGLIEMTIPDKPRSSKQKYRLTEKGRMLLAGIKESEK